ncbi:MAG: PilZ domain-containing protein [Pirellulaceae bacterium]
MLPAANSAQHRRRHDRETEKRQLVSLFVGEQVFLGDFVDTSADGIGAEFADEPTVEMGEQVRVLVRSRLHDAVVRHIRRTDSSMTFIGLQIVETLA